MALLNLIARLGLDNSGFDASLKGAEATANKFGKKFQSSIIGTAGRFLTLGFAVNYVTDKIKALEGEGDKTLVEQIDAEDIERQYEMIRSMEKRLETKQSIAKLDDEIGKIADQRFLKELSDEDRRTELIRRRIALLQILKTVQMPPLKAKELQLEGEKLLSQIGAIDDDEKNKIREPEFQTRNIGDRPLDPLARIGGFTGGGDVKIITIQERIASATEKTAENTGRNGVGFR
jgi:hypothetical protein